MANVLSYSLCRRQMVGVFLTSTVFKIYKVMREI